MSTELTSIDSIKKLKKAFGILASEKGAYVSQGDLDLAEDALKTLSQALANRDLETRKEIRKNITEYWDLEEDLIKIYNKEYTLKLKAYVLNMLTVLCMEQSSSKYLLDALSCNHLQQDYEPNDQYTTVLDFEFVELSSQEQYYKKDIAILEFLNTAFSNLSSANRDFPDNEIADFFYSYSQAILKRIWDVQYKNPQDQLELLSAILSFLGRLVQMATPKLPGSPFLAAGSAIVTDFRNQELIFNRITECMRKYKGNLITVWQKNNDYMQYINKTIESCIKLTTYIVNYKGPSLYDHDNTQTKDESIRVVDIILKDDIFTELIFKDLASTSIENQESVIELIIALTKRNPEFITYLKKSTENNLLINLYYILKEAFKNKNQSDETSGESDEKILDTRVEKILQLLLDEAGTAPRNICNLMLGFFIDPSTTVAQTIDTLDVNSCSTLIINSLLDKDYYSDFPFAYTDCLNILYKLSKSKVTATVLSFYFLHDTERVKYLTGMLGQMEKICDYSASLEFVPDTSETLVTAYTGYSHFDYNDWYQVAYLFGLINNVIRYGNKFNRNHKKLVDNVTMMLCGEGSALDDVYDNQMTRWNIVTLMTRRNQLKNIDMIESIKKMEESYTVLNDLLGDLKFVDFDDYEVEPYKIKEEDIAIYYDAHKIILDIKRKFEDICRSFKGNLDELIDRFYNFCETVKVLYFDKNLYLLEKHSYQSALESILALLKNTLGSCDSLEKCKVSVEILTEASAKCSEAYEESPQFGTLLRIKESLDMCKEEIEAKDDIYFAKMTQLKLLIDEFKRNPSKRVLSKLEKILIVMERKINSDTPIDTVNLALSSINKSGILSLAQHLGLRQKNLWTRKTAECRSLMILTIRIVNNIINMETLSGTQEELRAAVKSGMSSYRQIISQFENTKQLTSEDLSLISYVIMAVSYLLKKGDIEREENIINRIMHIVNYYQQNSKDPVNKFKIPIFIADTIESKLNHGLSEFVTFMTSLATYLDALTSTGRNMTSNFNAIFNRWKNVLYNAQVHLPMLLKEWKKLKGTPTELVTETEITATDKISELQKQIIYKVEAIISSIMELLHKYILSVRSVCGTLYITETKNITSEQQLKHLENQRNFRRSFFNVSKCLKRSFEDLEEIGSRSYRRMKVLHDEVSLHINIPEEISESIPEIQV